jgi:hypothetical protein
MAGVRSRCETTRTGNNWWYKCTLTPSSPEAQRVFGRDKIGKILISREQGVIEYLHSKFGLPLGSCLLDTFKIYTPTPKTSTLRGVGTQWLCAQLQALRRLGVTHLALTPMSSYNQGKLEAYYTRLGFTKLDDATNLWYTPLSAFHRTCTTLPEVIEIQGTKQPRTKRERRVCTTKGCSVRPRNPAHSKCSRHRRARKST